jgi:hypothetical protein
MAITERHKILVKEISDNIRKPRQKFTMAGALQKAGYSTLTSTKPKLVTETQGFKELCKKSGLTEDLVLRSIADDIKGKPKDRSKELNIGCKVLGLYKADNEQGNKGVIDIPDADFIEIIRAYRKR